ncbi:zymogen granule membrane protein 16-like [Plectropomus leopardus]|uniref:zymogen granule membrane protein 16-like n=1 Tax=Plectropomus leopardus TaxID=160734 RepID=UPI001C4BF355|nr:zymogen granule membrane protein 16-like [Plectropomus leopardus]
MFSFLFLAVLCTSCLAAPSSYYSFSPPVGPGSGTAFSTKADERLTGIRIWESTNSYITGLQVRNGYIWSEVIGRKWGDKQELILYPGEKIIQVSGKYQTSYTAYIYQLVLKTDHGRSLSAGQPSHNSFNMYADYPGSELFMLSGRYNSAGLKSVGAHWKLWQEPSNSNNTLY